MTLARSLAPYGAAVGLVAGATMMGAVVSAQVPDAQVSLLFMSPVLIAATVWGFGPSLVAAALCVASFDFFFTQPRLTFSIDRTADVATFVILALTAGGASFLGARLRRLAAEAQRSASRSHSLHELARAALKRSGRSTLLPLALDALEAAFGRPVVAVAGGRRLGVERPFEDAVILSRDDCEAAQWAIDNGSPTRAGNYPFFGSQFDFWPAGSIALGAKFGLSGDGRPEDADASSELICGYLAGRASLERCLKAHEHVGQ